MWIVKEEYKTASDSTIIEYVSKESGVDGIKWVKDIKKAAQFFAKVDAIAWVKYRHGFISRHFKFH